MLKVDASDEDSQSQAAFANVLIAAHACMGLIVAVQAVLSVKRSVVAVRDQPVANQSLHRSSFAQACEEEEDAEAKGESKL